MRLMVLFDLPTASKAERKTYSAFRKFLVEDGYDMEQFSVYTRVCMGRASAETHVERLKANLPATGRVTALLLTERQFEDRKVLVCTSPATETVDTGCQMTLVL